MIIQKKQKSQDLLNYINDDLKYLHKRKNDISENS